MAQNITLKLLIKCLFAELYGKLLPITAGILVAGSVMGNLLMAYKITYAEVGAFDKSSDIPIELD
jgi:hypothetical protein